MQTLEIKRKDIVNFFLKKGLLVSREFLKYLEEDKHLSEISRLVENTPQKNIAVLGSKTRQFLDKENREINWTELEKLMVVSQRKGKRDTDQTFAQVNGHTKKLSHTDNESKVKIIFTYSAAPKKKSCGRFYSVLQ